MTHELELKYALDENEYRRLEKRLRELAGEPKILEQVNTYLDGEKRELRTRGVALRLRRENRKFLLCAKSRLAVENGYFAALDSETEIDARLAEKFLRDGISRSEAAPLPPANGAFTLAKDCPRVLPLGRILNTRKVFYVNGLTMELDKTDFGRRIDHELEIETDTPDAVRAVVRRIFGELAIPVRYQDKTKNRRFEELNFSET